MLAPRYQAVMVFAQLVCMLEPQVVPPVQALKRFLKRRPAMTSLQRGSYLGQWNTNFAWIYFPSLTFRHCRFVWTFAIYLATRLPIRSPLCRDAIGS